MKHVWIGLLMSLPFISCNAATTNSESRAFWHPQYRGLHLAYCSYDKQQCGKSIADKYCQQMGYERSDRSVIANNIGLSNYLNTRLRCKGWECNGFALIDCYKKISHKPAAEYYYTKKRFHYPRFRGYRVDWCYDDGKQCGSKVAQSFCKRLGYMRSNQYRREKSVYASKTLGDRKLCFGSQCNGFEFIDCSR